MIRLTKEGTKEVASYLTELRAKRREILCAKLDTYDETEIPTKDDLLADIEYFEEPGENGQWEYLNCWGVTDHYNADRPLHLIRGVHYEAA